MNKISKKIVALVTMAAFVLTLVPAAAFAAPSATNSRIEVDGSQTVTDIDAGDTVTVDFVVNEDGTSTGQGTTNGLENVKVWVTDKDGNYVDTANIIKTDLLTQSANNKYVCKFQKGNGDQVGVTNDTSFQVTFTAGGEYLIHAGVGDIETNGQFSGDFINMNTVSVSVNNPDTTVKSIKLNGADNHEVKLNSDNKMGDFDLTGYTGWDQDGTAQYTVTGQAFTDKNWEKEAPEYKEVKLISGDSNNLQFVNGDSLGETVVKTDNFGNFKFTITMNDKRNIPVYVEVDGVRYALNIITTKTTAYDIDTAKDGGYVLATTDIEHQNDRAENFADAVQFTITDAKGDVLTGDEAIANEPAHNVSLRANATDKISITTQPKKSTLTNDELTLVASGDTYTLKYTGGQGSNTNDLYPGKYVVRVALASGDYADATFTAAEFGTAKDLVLDMTATDMSTGREVDLDDQVTLGQKVTVTGKYVDENGLKITADDVYFGVNGKAVTDEKVTADENAAASLVFYTKLDIAANESLLGTTIDIEAYAANSTANSSAQLTVVDSYNTFALAFNPTEGPVNEYNDVTVSVVKEDGSTAQVTGKIVRAFVDSQSNEDAIVTVKVNNADVTKGKGEISVYATEDTTADIVVVIKDSKNEGIYSGTLEYTAGDGNILAHHNVTMTIGSSQYVVDKQLFTMDAAPYVDSNWRTMVPIRALAEAFDANVEWNNDDRTVTIKYNEQTIVMTVGEKDYTINGETATMDTEAVIQGDRTYVPIRFAAEAMGFKVTPLYNANSSTASVVFQS